MFLTRSVSLRRTSKRQASRNGKVSKSTGALMEASMQLSHPCFKSSNSGRYKFHGAEFQSGADSYGPARASHVTFGEWTAFRLFGTRAKRLTSSLFDILQVRRCHRHPWPSDESCMSPKMLKSKGNSIVLSYWCDNLGRYRIPVNVNHTP